MRKLTIFFLSSFLFISLSSTVSAQSPCSNESFRAFDFWIGDWKVENANGKLAGYNSVQLILDSCVILENWQGAGPSRGKSFNHYDWQTKQWKQKWVDNFGSNLEFTGTVANDTAKYYCQSKNPKTGSPIYNRMMIAQVTKNEVHQLWEQSIDNVKWTVAFDGKYIRVDNIASAAIDQIYTDFTEAYATKNDKQLANLYSIDALYLSGNRAMIKGRDKINQNFHSHFKSVAERNQNMKIEFEIIDRRIEGSTAYDIGYYKLQYINKNTRAVENTSVGKFTTTLAKEEDGTWKFTSDSYNQAPLEAFGNKNREK